MKTNCRIKIFTLENCVQCEASRNYMTRHGISFEEHDAARYARRWQALGIKRAPIVEICGPQGQTIDMWTGFQPSRMSQYQPNNTTTLAPAALAVSESLSM
ncbi:hypothetical protein HMPREF0578_0924 [Mobiluncus mulieris 28-1]|uniref:NrdH-redoxin n=1 Tax=Mobiluncus mulieris TaxID=2052 RepID=A0A7Y0YIA0_9ACTO|nr:glutaredoxin domain-containing protein [Mobiluncus mulieris]EEZ91607.1 hypothetical protein HMPREF0578_0924 [Mobiluncus mulieris 28-1]MCU9972131.1 NrdH-redoxin [Mobiluncus mulieris]MCU9975908.1 NrdH-redoxin [Mobiluncus mulieris]MCU9994398.1 NrdH-redoxin [Mobiluncus mulieris]MCV0002963.1 NrdH-redoxin [Mobiluncus mulieris]